jgi:predicted transcriptional regulator
MLQPYELVVNKILPTIRAKLAQVLIQEYNLKQVDVAEKLGVTQAAVSHYNTHTRGADQTILQLFPEIEGFVEDLAKDIVEGMPRDQQVARLNNICWQLMYTERFCSYHRKIADLEGCNVCYEPAAQ